jgi:pimeloyl-ACP methyl ester carboxylesterase
VGSTTLQVPGPAISGRVPMVPTLVSFPATGTTGQVLGAGARPDHRLGPYPLVLFSPGYDIAPTRYDTLLDSWVAAGYVVAEPVYPGTVPPYLYEAHIVFDPAEGAAVIGAVISASASATGPLAGMVNPQEVAVVGHSDGGDVSYALAANSCCKDTAVKAVVVLSGAELTSFGGTYDALGGVPLLVVQGSADTVNVPACSEEIYDNASTADPRYYLNLLGAEHEPPYMAPPYDPPTAETATTLLHQQIVRTVTLDFLDAYLRGSASDRAAITTAGSVAGVSTIVSGAGALDVDGTCPGAPPP